MQKRRHIRKLGLISTAIIVILFSASTASAAINGYVTRNDSDKYYEYDYNTLVDSYVAHLLGASAKVYSDYSKKTMHAFIDDKNGYIDYQDVLDAYVTAILGSKSFNPDKYTAGSKAKKAVMPEKLYVVTLGSDGKLKYTKKVLDAAADLLAALNSAKNEAELEAVITSNAKDMDLDLAPFNKLNRYSQLAVLSEVLAKRPAQGFANLAKFKSVFNAAVAAAPPVLEAALKAVNEAADAAAMKKALGDFGAVLELGLSRYNLKTAEEDALAARLLKFKPFASAKELQTICHTSVMVVRSGYVIKHTRYSRTLKQMLDIQMGLSYPPQTDTYGGGWKNALRKDVDYYVNPYNFIDADYDGAGAKSVRITAEPNLKVRERPTTVSAQLKDAGGKLISVWQNEVYAILGQAQAEAGTAAGTEGAWYKIRASGKEGWVCGKYCKVVTGSSSVTSMFQFLVLSGSAGSTVEDLNKILVGKGILAGRGEAFMEGSRSHNINEIFLVSLALHETGNGASSLAKGIEVEDKDDLFPDGDGFVTVYNMFGIGAYDSNPNQLGAERAYKERWFTPEAAIVGGARFASESYVNHPTYFQNTLYKMRWNPKSPGNHQYATDIGWAAKQVSRIRGLYDLLDNYKLTFDIPRYQE